MNTLKTVLSPAPLRRDYADAGDLLRVLCVGMIAWYHIWQQSWLNPNTHFHLGFSIYPLVSCGYLFVDLLLLLSGFLLMLGWENGRGRSLRDFYVARVSRILPCYLLTVLVAFFAFALPSGAYGGSREYMLTDIFSHLSFSHTFFQSAYYYSQINGALWTLAIEMQFYLIFPFLARAFHKRPFVWYLGMLLFGVGARRFVSLRFSDVSMYFNQLPCMLDVYANGMLAAVLFYRSARRRQRGWDAWLCTALMLVCAVLMYRLFRDQQFRSGTDAVRRGQMLVRLPLTALGALFLFCASRAIGGVRMLMQSKLLRRLSALSFNFYLWHTIVLLQLKRLRIPAYSGSTPNQDGQQPWQDHYTWLCFGVALAISLITTYLVEKPLSKWIRRRFSRKCA